jgi:hypothetical protein
MALSHNSPPASGQFGVNHASGVTGLQDRLPPRNAGAFLERAKNSTFLDRKLISALYKTVDGHQLVHFKTALCSQPADLFRQRSLINADMAK